MLKENGGSIVHAVTVRHDTQGPPDAGPPHSVPPVQRIERPDESTTLEMFLQYKCRIVLVCFESCSARSTICSAVGVEFIERSRWVSSLDFHHPNGDSVAL